MGAHRAKGPQVRMEDDIRETFYGAFQSTLEKVEEQMGTCFVCGVKPGTRRALITRCQSFGIDFLAIFQRLQRRGMLEGMTFASLGEQETHSGGCASGHLVLTEAELFLRTQ